MTDPIVIQQYKGASMLNARQLKLSMQLMTGEQKPNTLSQAEIMQLLNVIESLAMSMQVYYDGSVQDGDKHLFEEHGKLYRGLLHAINLETPGETLRCAREAATQSRLLIQAWLAAETTQWAEEKPVSASDASAFYHAVMDSAALSASQLHDYAYALVKCASFRGNKAAAGILAAAPDADMRRRVVAAVERARAADVLGGLVAGLINRFRVNFVNELAAMRNAAYVAAPVIEDLKSQQTMLLWRYLGQKLQADSEQVTQLQHLSEQESQTLQSFPYAYALLMNKRATSPSKLLDLIFKVRDENVIASQASVSRTRYIETFTAEEFSDLQERLFADTYSDLLSARSSFGSVLLNVSRSCVPAVLALGAAGSGLLTSDNMLASSIELGITSLGVSAAPLLMRAGASGSDNSAKLYRDNYMRWNKLLTHAAKHRSAGGVTLQSRIAEIFDVRL